ncbi:MAG: LLM class flavin-dependent oxidoreductase [Chloroflexia bacterium]|nr:LLM class flavin-dependent oxidoreductase [Chloroflexia bacterium]
MSIDDFLPGTRRPLKVGLLLPNGEGMLDGRTARWDDFRTFAQHAEDAGFDALWTVDHLLVRPAAVAAQFGVPVSPQLAAEPPQGFWDCWMLLAALAGVTSRIRLGTLVSCTGYRNPVVLANMATTLDEASGGRLVLGLGAGNYADEHRSLGVPFDHQVSRFEEALAIILGLLRHGAVDFAGEWYTARECELRMRGPRPGGPPLLIGALGQGPRMLRLVAEYADYWNAGLAFERSHPDRIPPLRAAVDAACLAHGRDPATLARTVTIRVALLGRTVSIQSPGEEQLRGTPEAIAEAFRAFARAGIDEAQVWLAPNSLAQIEAFSPVLALLDGT